MIAVKFTQEVELHTAGVSTAACAVVGASVRMAALLLEQLTEQLAASVTEAGMLPEGTGDLPEWSRCPGW